MASQKTFKLLQSVRSGLTGNTDINNHGCHLILLLDLKCLRSILQDQKSDKC